MASTGPDIFVPNSERRYLSIVFVDLVGFTELSELLDPEDLRLLQHRYQNLALQTMERFGGFVAQFAGDGILVYFGYPTAHENDAERALRASLELIGRLPTLDTSLADTTLPPLSVRIGVHTGLVLMAPDILGGGSVERGAIGEAVNLAARLQAEAQPNAVVVSKETMDLLGEQFECVPLEPRPLKGVSREVGLFRVLRARPGAPRSTTPRLRGAPRMVGREAALARIRARWDEVRNLRRRRFVVVAGDAGVGKTRLVSEVCARPELAGATILQVPCHELFASTPLYPVASFLWTRASLAVEDSSGERAAKIATFLDSLGLNSAENRELVGSLLGLATGSAIEAIAPTPLLLKRRQFELVLAALGQSAQAHPTVLWVEDAHWLDASSAELLREAASDLAEMPLLVLATTRSFPKGPALPDPDEIVCLEQLPWQDCAEIARAIPGADALPDDIVASAVDSADGVPLFVEQLIISLVEERSRVSPAISKRRGRGVPLLLAEMMSERLDRRPGGRRIVQAAACIGRSFTPDFLGALLHQRAETLAQPLQSLVEAEILITRRHGPEIRYEFRHALLQRLAHESIVQADRRDTHEMIVAALRDAEKPRATPPEVLAHHLTEAGRPDEAIDAWLRAALSAGQRSAHVEAIEHVRRGLGLLGKVRSASERRMLELRLQAALVGSLMATEGATSDRVSECCRRGLELCQADEPSPFVLAFAFGQFTFTNCRGDVEEAGSMARLFLSMAERAGNASGRVVGHRMLGTVHFGQGDAAAARENFEASLRLYSPERDASTTHMFGQNTEVHTKSALSLLLLCAGEVDRALEIGVGALRSADELRHPHSTAIPLTYVGGWAFGLCGAAGHMTRQAERLIALAHQHRLGAFRAHGMGLRGWALCQQGELRRGAAELEQAVAALDALKFRLSISGYLGCWADALRRLGQPKAAQDVCRRALDAVKESSFRWFEPELRRIEALISCELSHGQPAFAVSKLREAAAFAERMGFPLLERRCLLSILRCAAPPHRDPDAEQRLRQLAHLGGLASRVDKALRAFW